MSSSCWSVISLMNQTILEPCVGTLSSAHKIGKGILKTATSNLIDWLYSISRGASGCTGLSVNQKILCLQDLMLLE